MDAFSQAILVFLVAILLPLSQGVNTSDVNSTGKGYVAIRRENTTATNITEDEPESPDASALVAERYHMPALFSTFNGGRPFYLEKDPITGAIDFDAHAADKQDGDYFYDDEVESDGIDRKDGSIRDSVHPAYPAGYNEYSNVHSNHKYHHSDKIPLISSSYANTKVQGTAGNHRTNKPSPTASTPQPSYYPVRPHHVQSTTRITSTTTTTSTPRPTTKTTSTPRPTTSTAAQPDELYEDAGPGSHVSNPSLAYEYEYDLDNFEDENSYFDGPKETPPPPRPSQSTTTTTTSTTTPSTTTATTKATTTTTPMPLSSSPTSAAKATTTVKTIQITPSIIDAASFSNLNQPLAHTTKKPDITSTTTTAAPPSVTRTTTVIPGIIYSEPSSNIVTSMPLGTHFHFRPPSTPGLPRQPEVTTRVPNSHFLTSTSRPNIRDPLIARPSDVSSNVVLKPDVNPYGTLAEEPFRPIFGPGEGIEETLPPSRLPEYPIPLETPSRLNYPPNEGTSNYFSLRPNLPPRISGIDPPRPLPPQPFILQSTSERPVPTVAPTSSVTLIKDNTTPKPKVPLTQWLAAPSKLNTGGQIKFPDDKQPPSPTSQDEDKNDVDTPIEVEPTATFLVPNRPSVRPQTAPVRIPATELRPPAEPDQLRPQTGWNINQRPPQIHPQPPQQNALPKIDTVQPTYVQGSHNFNSNHMKPNNDRPFHGQNNRYAAKNPVLLPNILPQFRPNAKVSHGHSDGLRHPNRPYFGGQYHHVLVDNLQPPPPPPPGPTSANLRINRNDGDSEVPFGPFVVHPAPPRPLVRRRTGPPVGEVATLQMMQQHQKQQPVTPGEKRPVFVVYPVNTGPSSAIPGGGETSDGGVVVGTRGPHLPRPPAKLDSSDELDLDDGYLGGGLPFIKNKNQKPILQPAMDREDTPVLKPQAINSNLNKRPIKSDFPYPIIRPETILEDETDKDTNNHSSKKSSGKDSDDFPHLFSSVTDESIEAEVHNSHIDSEEEDTEINIIPYLQDYLPFATKKPQAVDARKPIVNNNIVIPSSQNNQWTSIQSDNYEGRIVAGASNVKAQNSSPSAPISTTLTVVSTTSRPSTTVKPFEITDFPKQTSTPSKQHGGVQQGVVGSGGSEFTVSAIMHTHPQLQKQQTPPSPPSKLLANHKLSNSETSSVTPPAGLNFQAPFMASVNVGSGATPTNHGWSVVGASTEQHMRPGTVDKADLDRSDVNPEKSKKPSSSDPDQPNQGEPGSFDFENFKPQLFGGFKPIYSFPEEETLPSGSKLTRPQITTERQEKKLL